jgi:hypothetical protein
MTLPTVFFGFIMALLMGSGFHLWKGGGLSKLIQYLVVSMAGFWLGQLLAVLLQWEFLPVGALQFGFNVLGSVLFLFISFWLGSQNPFQKKNEK